jgi:multisubunit Na+/H+ antiporter MnhG subunit
MPSSLAAVPLSRRQHAATTAAVFSALLLAVGVLPWILAAPAAVRLLAAMSLVAGLLVASVAWALARSVRQDRREAALDADLLEIAGRAGCGHDHDPDELVVIDADSDPDQCPSGGACTHSCEVCALGRSHSDGGASRSSP